MKGLELFTMRLGESEDNVIDMFNKDRTYTPSVLYFDDLDITSNSREEGSVSDDPGGAADRIVREALIGINGVKFKKNVFITGAAN